MALFRVVDKFKQEENKWDTLFNIISDFKTHYGYELKNIDNLRDGSIVFTVSDYSIYALENSQGFWVTLESNTRKSDFDAKYTFIFNRINTN